MGYSVDVNHSPISLVIDKLNVRLHILLMLHRSLVEMGQKSQGVSVRLSLKCC
jgi:hypothetical protein